MSLPRTITRVGSSSIIPYLPIRAGVCVATTLACLQGSLRDSRAWSCRRWRHSRERSGVGSCRSHVLRRLLSWLTLGGLALPIVVATGVFGNRLGLNCTHRYSCPAENMIRDVTTDVCSSGLGVQLDQRTQSTTTRYGPLGPRVCCSACTSAWAFVYLFNDQGLATTTDDHLSQCMLEGNLHLRRCAFCLFE